MGLKCSPDIAQAAMKNVLSGIKDADVYINDVGAFSDNWDTHINLIATILQKLRENGFTINPLKCDWAVACSLAASIIIVTCGRVVHMF
jgi:hypothetical protein